MIVSPTSETIFLGCVQEGGKRGACVRRPGVMSELSLCQIGGYNGKADSSSLSLPPPSPPSPHPPRREGVTQAHPPRRRRRGLSAIVTFLWLHQRIQRSCAGAQLGVVAEGCVLKPYAPAHLAHDDLPAATLVVHVAVRFVHLIIENKAVDAAWQGGHCRFQSQTARRGEPL